jgi:hypothetical protein
MQTDKASATPKSALMNRGPQFGQSRIQFPSATGGFGTRSNFSGAKSTTSMGTGLASRFSIALSRVIDTPAPSAELQSDEDISEIVQLINELNQH